MNEMVSVPCELMPSKSTLPCSDNAPELVPERGLQSCSSVRAQLLQRLTLNPKGTVLYFANFALCVVTGLVPEES